MSSAAAESSRASLSLSATDGGAQSSLASLGMGPENDTSDLEEQQEVLRQWVALDADRQGDREEDLCYLVLNILFTILWRGVETGSRDCWRVSRTVGFRPRISHRMKRFTERNLDVMVGIANLTATVLVSFQERGQVMACINLLGLNNELHGSHLQLKLRLLEMGVQAALSDLRESASSAAGTNSGASSGAGSTATPPHASAADNASQLLRWVYDLVVLDPNPDCSKKVSTKVNQAPAPVFKKNIY